MSNTSGFRTTKQEVKKGDCLERTAFERYGGLVPSPITAAPPFWGGASSKWRNGGDGSGMRLRDMA